MYNTADLAGVQPTRTAPCRETVTYLNSDSPRYCGSVYAVDGECVGRAGHTTVIAGFHAQMYVEDALRAARSAEASARLVYRAAVDPDEITTAADRIDAIVRVRSSLELLAS